MIFKWGVIFGMTLGSLAVMAQDAAYLKQPPIPIQKLSGEITLDGISDEPAWENAYSVPFIVYRPVWGMEPSEKTELLVTYDDDFLYIAGRCYTEDPKTLVARNLVRDGWRGDDWMTFHVDSRFDRQNALVFSIYPLGSRYDAAVSNDAVDLGIATFNADFNMIWDAVSVVNDEGWFYEMKIPMYNLRFKPAKDGKIYMGISAARTLQHHQEVHQFPAIPLNVIDPMSKPSFKQPVVLDSIPRPRLFWLTPYVLGSRARSYVLSDQNTFEPQVDYNRQIGLDAKIGVSSYLTLDVSVNPDFAQVEADDQLVNLTRFSLFFPEKRLFFQEAAGLFDFNMGNNTQLFYSRRIGINDGQLTPVYGGLRLTGKLNENTDIGVLNMQSASTNTPNLPPQQSENFGVVRMRTRILNERSFIGFMATNRISQNLQNYAFGVDAMLNPVGNHYFLLSAAQTMEVASGDQTLGIETGRYTFLWENRQTDDWHHRLGYVYSGRLFDPGVGFVDRSYFHNFYGSINYGAFAQDKSEWFQYRRWSLLDYSAFLNPTSLKWETITLQSNMTLRTFSGVDWNLFADYNYEFLESPLDFGEGVVISDGIYQFATAGINYFPPTFRNIRSTVQLSEGGFFGGRRFTAAFTPTFNLGRHWEIRGHYSFNRLRFKADDLYNNIHVARFQVNFALDLHLSISWITQYNSTVDQFFNNFRLRYNFKDGHDLFIVWNENFFADTRVGRDLIRPISGDQALILKYSYTFDRLFK